MDLINKFKNEIDDWEGKIGIGDSVTLHQINLFERLYQNGDLSIYNPFERLSDGRYKVFEGYPNEKLPKALYENLVRKVLETARLSILTDVFITGANAITKDGKIISTDGTGNRVAAMIYGPKKVIVVVGANKIVNNVDEAISRTRNIAAPLNALRHYYKHGNEFEDLPCVKTGFCVDCNHPRRTCHYTVIVEGATEINRDRIHVIIIGKDLGC